MKRIPIDERTWALRLGAPIQLGTSYDVAKVTGIGRRILKRLSKAGFIHEVRPSPHLSMYYYAEILEFMERTAQAPNYWNHVRREAYITGTRLQEADLR